MDDSSGLSGKLSSMRDSADEIERRALTIRQSLETARDILNRLLPNIQSEAAEELKILYRAQSNSMQELPAQLQRFAQNLRMASDDIERASRSKDFRPQQKVHGIEEHHQPQPSNGAARQPDNGQEVDLQPQAQSDATHPAPSGNAPQTSAELEIKAKLQNYHKPAFVSEANKALYDEFTVKQGQFLTEQQKLEKLVENYSGRSKYLHDLQASTQDIGTNSTFNAIDTHQIAQEVDQLKKDMIAQQSTVRELMTQAGSLFERVDRVTPSAEANVGNIFAMANGQSSQQILDNTGSCVHYIAQRMPVPFAPNARFWDDIANQEVGKQYGVKVGSVPLVGSVIVMEKEHPYVRGDYGHVLYVEKLDSDGTVWVTDNDHPYPDMVRLDKLTKEVTGPNVHYLYFPWETQG